MAKVTLVDGLRVAPDDMDRSEERMDRSCPGLRRPASLITVDDLPRLLSCPGIAEQTCRPRLPA